MAEPEHHGREMDQDGKVPVDGTAAAIIEPAADAHSVADRDDAQKVISTSETADVMEAAGTVEPETQTAAMALDAAAGLSSRAGDSPDETAVHEAASPRSIISAQFQIADVKSPSAPVIQALEASPSDSEEMEIDPVTSPVRPPSESRSVHPDTPESPSNHESPIERLSLDKLGGPAALKINTASPASVHPENDEEEEEEEEVEMVEERTPSGKGFAHETREVEEESSQPLPSIQEEDDIEAIIAAELPSAEAEASPEPLGDMSGQLQEPEISASPHSDVSMDHVADDDAMIDPEDKSAASQPVQSTVAQQAEQARRAMDIDGLDESSLPPNTEANAAESATAPEAGPSTPREQSPQPAEDPSRLFIGHRFWVDLKRPDRRDLIRSIKVGHSPPLLSPRADLGLRRQVGHSSRSMKPQRTFSCTIRNRLFGHL